MSFDFGEYTDETHDDEGKLDWRDDPEKSQADWTIVVAAAGRRSSHTYHVHKFMLGAGTQQSAYFKGAFVGRASGTPEGSNQTSAMTLLDSAADAFPVYLDFCYTGELYATTTSATALLHLAHYLRCRSLHKAVTDFMQLDLSGATAAVYLREAEVYKLDKVAAAALPLCAAHLGSSLSSEEVEQVLALPPPLFQRVLLAPERACSSEELSVLMSKYCRGPFKESIDGAFITSAFWRPVDVRTEPSRTART